MTGCKTMSMFIPAVMPASPPPRYPSSCNIRVSVATGCAGSCRGETWVKFQVSLFICVSPVSITHRGRGRSRYRNRLFSTNDHPSTTITTTTGSPATRYPPPVTCQRNGLSFRPGVTGSNELGAGVTALCGMTFIMFDEARWASGITIGGKAIR